ncbi:MAG: hypothetical protein WA653_12630 [Candidatus Sulfotelmatobacter sp.]
MDATPTPQVYYLAKFVVLYWWSDFFWRSVPVGSASKDLAEFGVRDSGELMAKPSKSKTETLTDNTALKGCQKIAGFLGEPVSVVQRWGTEGMPVRREGRYVIAIPAELNAWMGKESSKPVHVATESTDLSAELKRGLSFIRRKRKAVP